MIDEVLTFGTVVVLEDDQDNEALVLSVTQDYVTVATKLDASREGDFDYSIRRVHKSQVSIA